MIYSLRVCVADDEPFMLMYLGGILDDLGHHIVAAVSNGAELVRVCLEHQPDLIVTDIRMPEMDGHDAVEAISREVVIPAVFVTGFDRFKDVVEMETRCVGAYLIKPFSAPDLKNVIRSAMGRFGEFQILLEEDGDVDQAFEDRRVVARAKEFLARQDGMTEGQAFDHLRRRAGDLGVTTGEAARRVLGEAPV